MGGVGALGAGEGEALSRSVKANDRPGQWSSQR